MKKIMLAAALIAVTFSAAIAQRPVKAENDAAMKAGRKALTSKTTELETDIKRHDNQAAETVAMDILALMRQGVGQTRRDADLMTGEQHKARMQHMLDMEDMVRTYISLSKDVNTNGQKLVDQARTFLNAYN